VRISSTDGQATRPADHTFTGSDAGVYTFSGLILRTAAAQSVTATDIVTGSITGTQSGVVVTPGSAATLRVGGITAPVMRATRARSPWRPRTLSATARRRTWGPSRSEPRTCKEPSLLRIRSPPLRADSIPLRSCCGRPPRSRFRRRIRERGDRGLSSGIAVNPASAVALTLTGFRALRRPATPIPRP